MVKNGSEPRTISDKEAVWKFMREHFYVKECSRFVPQPTKVSSDGSPLCSCGAVELCHIPDVRCTSVRNTFWSEEDIVKMPTNAFGKIAFQGLDCEQKSRYIRLSDDSDICDVVQLLANYWHLSQDEPELLISVIGDGVDFNMTASLKSAIFDRGLIPAVEVTKGWITTFGLNVGIGKAIGDAICAGQYYYGLDSKTTLMAHCIGITPWGLVRESAKLMCSGKETSSKEYYRSYDVDPKIAPGEAVSLNPFHSHFLFVDDGHRNGHANVAKFRAQLEKKISEPKENGGLNIPTVCILVGGDSFSLLYLESSASMGLSSLVCEGTGRAADLVCHAYRRFKELRPEEKEALPEAYEDDLKRRVAKTLYAKDDPTNEEVKLNVAATAQRIVNICRHSNVYLIDVLKSENAEVALLLCLLECQQAEIDRKLQLAIRWKRPEVAKAKIFAAAAQQGISLFDPAYENVDKIFKYFTDVLVEDQLDFIKLFIDQGFPVTRYLSVNQLRHIYRLSAESQSSLMYMLKMSDEKKQLKAADSIYLCHISSFMKNLTNRFLKVDYVNDKPDDHEALDANAPMTEPYQDLLIWALLLCRIETAAYFWTLCADPLITAVAATLICDRLSDRVDSMSSDAAKIYREAKQKFEEKATHVIDIAFSVNKEKAMKLARNQYATWGDSNCMDLASAANDNDFLASQCCQTNVFAWWKYGFDASGLLIVLSTFIIFPVLFFVDFDDDSVTARDDAFAVPNVTKKHSAGGRRTKRAPSVRYTPSSARTSVDFQVYLPFLKKYPPQDSTSSKKITWTRKLYTFYTSPVVKFTNHVLWYLIFLVLHAYVLLFSFRYSPTLPEIILHVWIFTFLCELCRTICICENQSVIDKFLDYLSYSSFGMWNRLEIYNIYLEFGIIFLRMFDIFFGWARLFMALNFILFTFRLYKVFLVNSYLGPLVIMMLRMTKDLFMFLMLLIVMMVAYSVTSQALLYPHRDYYANIFYDILNHGIWEIFGDLDNVITDPNLPQCGANETTGENVTALMSLTAMTKDCNIRNWSVPLLLAIYLFFGNVLLVNMLIAIFASIFEDVHKNSEQLWKSLMFCLVTEYKTKPLLPPPFIVLNHIHRMFTRCCKKKQRESLFAIHDRDRDDRRQAKMLTYFETECRSDYLDEVAAKEEKSTDMLIKDISQNVTQINKLVAELHRQRLLLASGVAPAAVAASFKMNIDSFDIDDGRSESDDREVTSPTDIFADQ